MPLPSHSDFDAAPPGWWRAKAQELMEELELASEQGRQVGLEAERYQAERDRAIETRENANAVSIRVEAENRRLWGGLLVYGNHTQRCGSRTAAACDCGWHKVQMEAEQRA